MAKVKPLQNTEEVVVVSRVGFQLTAAGAEGVRKQMSPLREELRVPFMGTLCLVSFIKPTMALCDRVLR